MFIAIPVKVNKDGATKRGMKLASLVQNLNGRKNHELKDFR